MDHITNIKLRRSDVSVQLKPTSSEKLTGNETELQKCLICLTNRWRYTCPKCQVYYCSAECYKSDRHQDCSEDFFKKLVEEALRSDHVTTKEKEKMIQILKKQKEEIENEVPIEDLLENKFEKKFEDLGLGEDENEEFENIEEILNSMTEEERKLFEEAIKDNSIVEDIKSKLKPWWADSFNVIPENVPKLVEVPRIGQNAKKINQMIFLQISELLAVYCFTFERFLHDPEDLIEESTSLILETSSAFKTEPLPDDRDEIFWKSFDKMRIMAEDDYVALDGFSLAAQLCQKQIKIRYALSHIHNLFRSRTKREKNSKIKNQFKLGMKKIEFYLSWILEDLVPVGDYILNLNQFQDRIRKEMKQFESEKDILEHSKLFEKSSDAKILISEL